VTTSLPGPDASLLDLGWSAFFADQLTSEDESLSPARVTAIHRTRLGALSAHGGIDLALARSISTADFAIGDWVLVEPSSGLFVRLLERRTLLQRRTEGRRDRQLGAANVDTLFIVSSCNADFNAARLERYLALANQAGSVPVLVLTKADTTDAADTYRREAEALQRGLSVVLLNAKSAEAASLLAPWCGAGRTVALIGSSGVGKSTLVNTLAGLSGQDRQETGAIRAQDAKGRHTTTTRSMHPLPGGGWVIDTPGLRSLHVSEAGDGIDQLFSEITDLAPTCRFRDCTHAHEPGCAVQAAVLDGRLSAERLSRWRKLFEENRDNTPVLTGPRGNKTPARKGRPR